MWKEEVEDIVLVKSDRGLGFSILDYQDPLNQSDTVIVVRSLVPGGVAQVDGRLVPGDRIMYVNTIVLHHASLDTAVQALKGKLYLVTFLFPSCFSNTPYLCVQAPPLARSRSALLGLFWKTTMKL